VATLLVAMLVVWAGLVALVSYRTRTYIEAERRASAEHELLERMIAAGEDMAEIRAAIEALRDAHEH